MKKAQNLRWTAALAGRHGYLVLTAACVMLSGALGPQPVQADACGNVVTVERYTVLSPTSLKEENGDLLDNGQFQLITSTVSTWSESFVSGFLPVSGSVICNLAYYDAYKNVGCLTKWVRSDAVYTLGGPWDYVVVGIKGISDPNTPKIYSLSSRPNATVNKPHSDTLQVTRGSAPFSWKIVANPLPPGLALGAASGVISGTPTTAGTFGFKLRVTDAQKRTDEKDFTITVANVPSPNLTPYKPAAWSDKIVVSRTTGTTTDSSSLTTADTLYVDLSYINAGNAPTAVRVYTELYVDGALYNNWHGDPPVNPNGLGVVQDFPIGTLRAGPHTLKIKVDATGVITESNESDNEYTRTITISQAPDPTPPTVVITSPTAGQSLTTSPVTASGGASDPGTPSSGVSLVQLRVNYGAWQTASGTTTWSVSVPLSPGSNTLDARSQDIAGNYSTLASVTVTYSPPPSPAPSIISVSPNPVIGSSSPQPFYINGANFVSGCNVTLRDLTAGQTLANSAITSFSISQILINPNFPSDAHNWSVEIINPDGQTSGQFNFSVVPPIVYSTTTSSSPPAGGITSGAGGYASGQPVTVAAKASPGYTFVNWTENGTVVSTSANYTFTITGNRNLVANFTANSAANYTITVNASPTSGGKVSGGGTFKPGDSRPVKATPNTAYLFANWTENGAVVSTSASYTFSLNRNRDLTANFVANPFAATKGTYNGLFYETNGISHQRSGSFTIATTEKGAFSGSLQVRGTRSPISGQFDASGKSSKQVPRVGLNPLTVDLQLDLSPGTDAITGSVSDGTWTAVLTGDRAVFNGKMSIAPQAGQYTLIVPASPNSASEPGGDSYATVKVDAAGRVTLIGSLADGTKISQAVSLSRGGEWPFYVSLYSGQGSILGWLTFTTAAAEDLTGNVIWSKSNMPVAKFYPGGFVLGAAASGMRYMPPASGNKVLSLTDAQIVLTGGGLPQGITNHITLGPNNKITSLDGNKLTLTLTPSTGLFKGSLVDPATSRPILFNGVVLQKSNFGSGFFLGTTESGKVVLTGN